MLIIIKEKKKTNISNISLLKLKRLIFLLPNKIIKSSFSVAYRIVCYEYITFLNYNYSEIKEIPEYVDLLILKKKTTSAIFAMILFNK